MPNYEALLACYRSGQISEHQWQDASEYRRLHPLLNQVATHLSLTQEQVDAMWQQALTA